MTMNVRPAAVAGMFYPESADVLARDIAHMLPPAEETTRPKAVIVPHAGYIYSGPTAASVYSLLSPLRKIIRRIILLGPTHRVAVNGLALPTCMAFATPLGNVPIDEKAVAKITNLPQIVFSDAAHAQEHSLEVQKPFLQTVLETFR